MMKHGDFTGLAADYARFRAGYAPQVTTAILNYVGRDPAGIDAADIGAGTGIWTRTLAARGLHSVAAVEPNDDMREQGIETSRGANIVWHKGSAEATGLPDGSADLVTMASSLHWADFDNACDEFHRILRPGGVFAALWNPRLIEANPLLVEIEAQITRLKPDLRRVSSGRSGITERLTDLLSAKPQFAEVLYLEARHSLRQTPEQYIGAWRSVNDLQVQLGPELFRQFLDFTEKRIAGLTAIETTYLTRAWAALRALGAQRRPGNLDVDTGEIGGPRPDLRGLQQGGGRRQGRQRGSRGSRRGGAQTRRRRESGRAARGRGTGADG